ncbi:MAG: phosphodiester glycosidase family protein [Verrucomicrobiaceae bacterium]
MPFPSAHSLALLIITLMIVGCAPKPITPPRPAPSPAPLALPTDTPAPGPPTTPAPTPQPSPTARHPLLATTTSKNGITFTLVSYDRRDFSLEVFDQANGPATQWPTAQAAASPNGLAAINAGFFTPQGKPLGLVIEDGSTFGSLNRTSFLGSGFFASSPDRLLSRDSFLKHRPSSKNILQSGPRLVWQGTTLTGLSHGEKRPRSFLLWDGRHHFAIGHAHAASLASLAAALKAQPLPGFSIQYALNLDGGRSSDLWVGPQVKGGSLSRRSWMNKPVRNYLVLKRK